MRARIALQYAPANYLPVHACDMPRIQPFELVKALVDRAGGTLPVAKAMKARGFQPTLHKFVSGKVPQPTHTTAARISSHFGLPIEAIYDARVATEWHRKLIVGGSQAAHREPEAPPRQPPPEWPFKRLSPEEWDRLGTLQAVVEHAAVTTARQLLQELADDKGTSRKRQANGA